MGQRILLNLSLGDWQTGFPSVTAQLWEYNQQPIQFVGSLPAAPHLEIQYQRWQQLYKAIYGIQTNWRRSADFEFDTAEPTNISQQDFETLCATLQTDLNQWLMAPTFTPIERWIRTHLTPQDEIRVMLTAQAKTVLRFPWRLWHLFEDYPNAELSLSLPTYSRSLKQALPQSAARVKILAVLGNDEGIDIATDQKLLGQLPAAQVTLLAQPTLSDLQHHLWEGHWDVLFFAGHSTSQGQGHLQVNATESLTVEQLKYALRRAIANGLQLAILNSCDGLGLAWELADLHLPQTIVMGEPVPDAIAHQFLKGFLEAFSQGQPLYHSVREAREKLHGLTQLGHCAAWLPVIVQNPAEEPPTWLKLLGQPASTVDRSETQLAASTSAAISPPPTRWLPPRKVSFIALSVAAVVLGLRWLGLLQGVELRAYDALMKLRPTESPDPRLVVITVDERDIRAQTSPERRGSLSDETLYQVLEILSDYQPRIIGLDIYRDFQASTGELEEALKQPNILGVCKSIDPIFDPVGIGPPPEMPPEQVGFSDFIEETDGILRRQLLTIAPEAVSPCTARYGFAALVALHYLGGDGIESTFTQAGNWQLGETVLPRLQPRTGGLQRMDSRGNQLLLNYRALLSPDQIATKVPLQDLLARQVNPESIRDRIVLIGVTSTTGDYWSTPYGVQTQNKTPGVFLQAQKISQIISTVQDGRPLIWVWPQWAEASCIAAAAIVGSLLACRWKSSKLSLACLLLAAALGVGAWAALLIGGWLPLTPTLIALGGGAVATKTALPSK
ncbi:MAG: CHASE2 domain-containing protein [Leptolyngbya sp. SIO1E4]|nr:CHASE2 domain-containing protein [Leptolyngbya sp. SIO1E4]